jgi:thioesterase domain-containing protein
LFNASQLDTGVIPDPLYAWPGLAAEIEVHTVPGDHDGMLAEPNVAVLARVFDESLRKAQERNASRPTLPSPQTTQARASTRRADTRSSA